MAAIHVQAFGTTEESLLVAALRHRREHDPDLSLVAEVGGQLVGHILFVPVVLTLAGTRVRAAYLSPVAVQPQAQGRGIGSGLIRRGHQVCRDKGVQLSVLAGHPGYYPRFGYVQRLGGTADLVLPGGAAGPGPDPEERPVTAADVPLLLSWWERWGRADDCAFHPGIEFSDWLTYSQRAAAGMFTRGGQAIGYARYLRYAPGKILALLAADGAGFRAVASALARRAPGEEIILPVHPASAAAREIAAGLPVRERYEPWPAFMMLPVVRLPAFERFRAEVEAGRRPIARAGWPAPYEVAGV